MATSSIFKVLSNNEANVDWDESTQTVTISEKLASNKVLVFRTNTFRQDLTNLE